jgi:hypothetical protein
MVFSTTVQDSDEDGLLDAWEEKGGFMTVPTQTNKIPFKVDLYAMGARKDQKDLFVQIDYMQEFANGDGVAEHAHLPRKEALDMVGDAFLKAPAPPNGPGPIHVHFDVGNNYQAALPKDADPYIIPFAGGLAKGGNVIDERSKSTYCGTASDCAFPNQAGLVSWKKGIQHIKNNFFPEERFGIFHYVLFGHALAMTTKEEREKGPPYALKSISGRADLPGDTVVVTLGRWRSAEVDKYVGSKDLQAATLLHELAHNLWGFHGGITFEFDRPLTISDAIVPRPNCNPNKQSVLNYLYQSAGLLDASGKFSVDLSREVLTAPDGAQDENALNEFLGIGAGNSFYRLRWYALFDDVLDRLGVQISPAKAHCNGTPIIDGEPNMVRVDNFGVTRKPVDWNYDKNGVGSPHLDINFDGDSNVATEFMDKTTDFKGFNDWLAIVNLHGLQQVGTGRNIYGLSLKVIGEDLLQLGEDDLGEDDLGEPNTPGQPTLGEDDLGEDDLGEDDLGEDDLGEDDLGDRDIDETTALAIGVAPTGLTGVPQSGRNRGILLTWNPLAFGEVAKYSVYRAVGQELTTLTKIGEVDAGPTPSFLDTNTRNNQWYTYVVTATFNETVQSNLSNPVTVRQ